MANQPNATSLKLVLTAADGTTTTINVNIDANATAKQITKAVYEAIPKSSTVVNPGGTVTYYAVWSVVLDPNGTTIEIYSARATTQRTGGVGDPDSPALRSPIKSIDATPTGTKAKPTVVIINTSPTSAPLTEEVVFAPNSIDGTAAVRTTTTFDLNIDGTDVTVIELAGASFTQVENDLYAQAISMGLTGISISGDALLITNNFSGQPVGSVGISANTQNGDPESFIDTTVSYL